jgi:glycosyltransferase involved in cell wall biosynthesis
MTYPFLSICIPNYERKEDLIRCLNSIFSLPENILKRLEVCVLDNNSSYDFNELMFSLHPKCKFVFKKNLHNIGFDRNLLEVLKLSSASYVMLLGNDDVVISDGIERLIAQLEIFGPDAVFSNYQVTFVKSGEVLKVCAPQETFNNLCLDWILMNVGEKCTFISSITFRRDVLVLDEEVIGCYVNKAFIHMAIMFASLKKSNSIVYLSSPTVNAFDSNEALYNVKTTFLVNLGFIINSFKTEYDKTAINAFKLHVLKHVVFSRDELFFNDLINFKFVNFRSIILMTLSKPNILSFVQRTYGMYKNLVKH